MSYVIYNLKSKHRYATAKRHESWGQKRVAKTVFTKAVNAGQIKADEWTIATYDEWRAADHKVERTHANDGKTKSWINASDVGGPCDPGMERYWTT